MGPPRPGPRPPGPPGPRPPGPPGPRPPGRARQVRARQVRAGRGSAVPASPPPVGRAAVRLRVARRPRRITHDRRDQDRGGQAEGAEERERGGPAVGADGGQGERRDSHAERLRALPDTHGQAPLASGEPAQDEPPAGGVDRCPGGPGRGQAGAQRGRAVHGGPGQQDRPGQRQARTEHQALPPAVGGRSPGHQREEQARGGAGNQNPRLLQGKALSPEGRDQVGQAVLEGAARGHREQAGHQDHPAPATRAGVTSRVPGTGPC